MLASGLANPRGLLRLDEHTLLVAEAGTGDPNDRSSGRLLRLADRDGDGTLEARQTVIDEPERDALLVALFSGQIGGDTAGSGVDFVEGSGKVVRVDPRDGSVTDVVVDLNAPIDLALAPDGRLLVLEFCDAFVDPVADLDDARAGETAGGFSRFSGRLLAVEPDADRTVIAGQLDLPTHVLVDGDRILVTEGQGTPGRTIPGPEGPRAIDGRIVELTPR